jgi:hypothetical protein
MSAANSVTIAGPVFLPNIVYCLTKSSNVTKLIVEDVQKVDVVFPGLFDIISKSEVQLKQSNCG